MSERDTSASATERRVHEIKFAKDNDFSTHENEITVLVAAFNRRKAMHKAAEYLKEERQSFFFDGIEALHAGSHGVDSEAYQNQETLEQQDDVLIHPGVPFKSAPGGDR